MPEHSSRRGMPGTRRLLSQRADALSLFERYVSKDRASSYYPIGLIGRCPCPLKMLSVHIRRYSTNHLSTSKEGGESEVQSSPVGRRLIRLMVDSLLPTGSRSAICRRAASAPENRDLTRVVSSITIMVTSITGCREVRQTTVHIGVSQRRFLRNRSPSHGCRHRPSHTTASSSHQLRPGPASSETKGIRMLPTFKVV